MCVRRAEPLCEREGGPRAEPHASPTTAEKAVSYDPDRCPNARPGGSPFPLTAAKAVALHHSGEAWGGIIIHDGCTFLKVAGALPPNVWRFATRRAIRAVFH